MSPNPRIVLDANVLVRAVLGARVRRVITDHADHVDFFAPDVAYVDAREHLPRILEKHSRHGEVEPGLEYLTILRGVVLPVAHDVYEHRRVDALARIGTRDADDWPVLASALVLDCPVWTEDQDFFGTGVPTWTTDRVELFLAQEA